MILHCENINNSLLTNICYEPTKICIKSGFKVSIREEIHNDSSTGSTKKKAKLSRLEQEAIRINIRV
jgi:hypothetical protein